MAPQLRTSERTSFKQCRWRWWVAHVLKLRPKVDAPALRFGSLVHAALEEYYRPGRVRGRHPAVTFAWLYEEELEEAEAMGFRDDEGKWQEAGDLGVRMLEGYVERWEEKDQEYEVVASEQRGTWPIKVGRRTVAEYVFTLDVTLRHLATERLWIMDHKTATAIKVNGLVLDDQAGSYWTYGPPYLREIGVLPPGEEIEGMIFNFLRKAAPNPDKARDAQGRVLNKDGSVSKQQPAPYFHREVVLRDPASRAGIHSRVKAEADEIERARRGELAIYKNPGPLHNPNCNGCPVRAMCELHEDEADWEAFRDMTMEPHDPYEVYDEGSG